MFRTSTDETKKAKAHNTRWSQGVSHSIALFDFGDRTKTGIFSMVQRLFVALCATRSEGAIHLFISGIIASNGKAMAPSHEKWERIRFPFPLPSSNTQLHKKRVCLHSHFVMATPDSHRQMHRRTFWRSTGGKVVTPVHPMLQPPCLHAVFEIGGNTL